ncbi:MAG: bifunctional D-glycero-beta-D-manno-heptose-7-phosphate kinase/D-glycero-beta-D-manno-heptose 1-phosphate adenylyltransferase HldE, partial [Gammaproteobacteria bacterium]|nr:bifunctional D-glycero-beta-D-manno-heptose-7-phosphate kinase/D-glycero-beta-D-manno-heptose 1-phosphate adenylyltransferase HldE [Gammaproteobacteria bacterium]
NCHFKRVDGIKTTTKLRVLSQKQQLMRLDFEEHLHRRGIDDLPQRLKERISRSNAVIFSDYAKGLLEDVQTLIQVAKEYKIPVLVDPKGSDFSRYRGATLVTPNLKEFEDVVGPCIDEHQLVEKGKKAIREYCWEALLVTRGEQGMTLFRADKPELHLPAISREVFDVTGAGDTVIGVLASALASGSSIEDAVAISNIAAGIVVTKLGTATVSAHEIRRKLHSLGGAIKGVMTAQQLKIAVEEAKAHGERIIMTNGCFDILHVGHATYLQQARQLGDRLIVAVNDDESVRYLKGEGRPVNSVERRMSVLTALNCVDWVVSFSEETPLNLIKDIMPDVLVKGGDYTIEQIAGAKEIMDNGGKVKILPYTEGVSTSKIISIINQKKQA